MNPGKAISIVVATAAALVLIVAFAWFAPESSSQARADSNGPGQMSTTEKERVEGEANDKPAVSAGPRDFDPLPKPLRPDELGEKILKDYYPEGRTSTVKVSSILEGTAKNREWGLQGTYHLNATSEQRTKWTVIENNGQEITFKVEIPVSMTNLFASERKYSLHRPDTPIANKIIEELIKLRPDIWMIIKMIEAADPNLRRTATAAKKYLEKLGLSENEIKQLGLKVRQAGAAVEGVTTRVTYRDGMGVIDRQQLQGGDLSDAQIRKINSVLRQTHPILAAYFLYPVQAPPGGKAIDTSVGEAWTVNAKHLGGLVMGFLEHHVQGQIRVKRQRNEDGRIVLKITKGDVGYQDTGLKRVDAELDVKAGTAIYLQPLADGGYAIERGAIQAEASIHQRTVDHWMFEEKFQASPRARIRIHGDSESEAGE
jgi:hypothetical protein